MWIVFFCVCFFFLKNLSFVQCRKFKGGDNSVIAACCCMLAQHIADGCRWQLFSSHLFIFTEVIFIPTASFFFFKEWWELSIFTKRKYCMSFVSIWNIIKIHSKEDELSWKFSWCALHVFKEASAHDFSIVVVHWYIQRKDVNSVSLAVMAAA